MGRGCLQSRCWLPRRKASDHRTDLHGQRAWASDACRKVQPRMAYMPAIPKWGPVRMLPVGSLLDFQIELLAGEKTCLFTSKPNWATYLKGTKVITLVALYPFVAKLGRCTTAPFGWGSSFQT